jgi:gluconokinase
MQQPFILGIDIGTGSTKAVAVNFSGEPFLTSQSFYPTAHPRPGYSEQDPELIWQAFILCINEIQTKIAWEPTAISLSSAMHSVIPVNSHGHALHPMITWADGRSAAIAEDIRNSTEAEAIYRTTGTPVFAMSPLSKIIWLREKEPAIFKDTYKFISIKEYIWHKLFSAFQIDHSVASGTGLFDIESVRWNQKSLALAQINEAQLSDPVSTGYTRYDFNAASSALKSVANGTAFVIGGSDGCLANLGSLAIQKGTAAITIGTSGAVRIANSNPVYNFKAMTFNYRLDEETFICGGPVNNGGIAIQWLLKNLNGRDRITTEDYTALFEKTERIHPGSEGLVFLPYLTGERAPVWDTNSSGVFIGVRLHHGADHFSRAVLEGICFGLNQVLEALEKGSGYIEQVHVSGGFVTSRAWISMLADITGKKIAIVQAEDASAIGAAMLAMKSLKIIDDYSNLIRKRSLLIIEPDAKKHEMYKASFQVFKQLYEPLKDAMHLLHQVNS